MTTRSLIIPFMMALYCALLCKAGNLHGDVIILKNGNQLEGTLEEVDEGKVRIVLKKGSIVIDRALIEEIIEKETDRQVYEKRLKKIEQKEYEFNRDKVKDLFDLYDFCKEKQLEDEARVLLEAVLEIDPDNEKAKAEQHDWEILDKARRELAREWKEERGGGRAEAKENRVRPLEEEAEAHKREQLEKALTDVSTENMVVYEGSGFDKIRLKYRKDFIIERFGEPTVSDNPPNALAQWADALDVEYEYYSYSYLPMVFVIFKPRQTIEAILFEHGFAGKLKRGITIGSTRDEVFETYGRPRRTLEMSAIEYPYPDSRVLYVAGRRVQRNGLEDEPDNPEHAPKEEMVYLEDYSIISYPRPFHLTFYFDEQKRLKSFLLTSDVRRKLKKRTTPSQERGQASLSYHLQ